MDTRPSDKSSSRKRAAAGECRVSARPAPEAVPRRVLVLSSGIALGAFEAGAFAAIEEADDDLPEWITAASIGAVNAAIIAGNRASVPTGLLSFDRRAVASWLSAS